MNHLKHLTFFTLLLLGAFACKENTIEPDVFGSLTGQVLHEADNTPVVGATISTTPASSTVQSAEGGSFLFETIKEGSFTVRAEAPGLVSGVETVTIFENETSHVVILMSEPEVTNLPPEAPNSPIPADGALDQTTELSLAWEAIDPNEDDELTFDVCIFSGSAIEDTIKFFDLTEKSVQVGGLRFNTTYFWQVSANDGTASPVFSELWRFTTEDFPDHPFVFSRVFDGVYEIYGGQFALDYYQLTTGGSNYRPRISPLGDRIAYINANFPQKQLYVMDRNGDNPTLVPTPVPIDGEDPFELDFCWSPDGTQLLFMNEERLYKVNIDGTGPQLFAELNGEEFIEVDWNGPTGKVAARTVGSQPYESRILLYEEDGTFLQEIVPDGPGSIGGPTFSVDGTHLLYTRDTTGFEDPAGRQLQSHIFLREIATGIDKDLSSEKPLGFNDLDARFSPDGALVIFMHTNNFPNQQRDIYAMNLEGEGRTLIFENSEMPDWWP